MTLCLFNSTGGHGSESSSPWDQACKQWDDGIIQTHELISIARDLFEGDALADILADIDQIKRA